MILRLNAKLIKNKKKLEKHVKTKKEGSIFVAHANLDIFLIQHYTRI